MHAVLARGTRVAWRTAARRIAGRRFPTRHLHSSNTPQRPIFPWSNDHPAAEDSREQHDAAAAHPAPRQQQQHHQQREDNGKPATDSAATNGPASRERSYGSAARRWMRNRRPKDLPPVQIPAWFYERNVKLREESASMTDGVLELVASPFDGGGTGEGDKAATAMVSGSKDSATHTSPDETPRQEHEKKTAPDEGAAEDRVYRISTAVMAELEASISAGLSLSGSDGAESFASGKSHLKLHCPVDGGIYMIEKAVEEAARRLNADIIRIDAQDLAEIAGDYIKEGPDATANSLWSLGYDAQQIFPRQSAAENDEGEEGEGEGEEEASMEEDEKESRAPKQPQFTVTAIPMGQLSDILKKMRGGSNHSSSNNSSGRASANSQTAQLFGSQQNGNWGQGGPIELPFPNPFQAQNNGPPQWNDLKLNALLEGLLEANHAKRFDPPPPSSTTAHTSSKTNMTHQQQPQHEQQQEPSSIIPSDADSASVVEADLPTSTTHPDSDATYPQPPSDTNASEPSRVRTIILIRGYKELSIPPAGRLILEKIQTLIQKHRKDPNSNSAAGPTMIIGTTASADLTPDISRAAFDALQTDGANTPFRTMVLTPADAGPAGGLFFTDAGRRIREINTRHLFGLLARLSPSAGRAPPTDLPTFARGLADFDAAAIADASVGVSGGGAVAGNADRAARLSAVLDDAVLSFDEVHRLVHTALGVRAAAESEGQGEEQSAAAAAADATAERDALGPVDIMHAMALLDGSDAAKGAWARQETALEEGPEDGTAVKQQQQQEEQERGAANKTASAAAFDARLRKIRKTANSHEKVLMRGVVHPDSIRTTFADVHAPPETVTALKTLTTLTLTRPEAFTYGVLATDKITGVLLYGPPGTGKTLLARAVAKESGATVLEVSGSDVYDMYVGESEKNVRAIFSLARKLSPCVIFVDEADAIFASRGSGTSRNTHRELINQFLREWDGLREAGAVLMVATNRPFDLDDAALRRLPRRLLVDLPSEQDRARILAIHCAGETLAPGVELAALAAATPLYSGSDLKNLVVAAALAAVREESDLAASRQDYAMPARRTLHARHFDKAMEEITASVSDDMSSLGAIRKFDEKYGDKRGRRKRASYGFGGGEGVREDAAKVRS